MAKTAKKKAATRAAASTTTGIVHLMHPAHELEDARPACDPELTGESMADGDTFAGINEFKTTGNACPDCMAVIVEMEAGYVQNIMRGQGHLPHV